MTPRPPEHYRYQPEGRGLPPCRITNLLGYGPFYAKLSRGHGEQALHVLDALPHHRKARVHPRRLPHAMAGGDTGSCCTMHLVGFQFRCRAFRI